MTDDVVPFIFEHDHNQTPIRTLMLNGDLWFVAADVCRALGLDNVTAALRSLDADETTLITNKGYPGPGLNVISEPGLYKLIQGSRKPAAKRFDRFVRHEILPSVRKTGKYETGLPGHECQPELLVAMNAGFDAVNRRLDGIETVVRNNKRKNFSRDSERYACEGLAKHCSGECPYCNEKIVTSKFGELLDNAQLHHGNGNARDVRPENCMPICDDCHERVTHPSRPDHILSHVALGIAIAFHRLLRQKSGKIQVSTKVIEFWDFRASTQSDMGWPKSKKKITENAE